MRAVNARVVTVASICLCVQTALGEASGLLGENYAVTSWTVEDGLPGNALSALAPARDGYLWVGSLNGLARFDGVRFVRFHSWDGLTSLQIQQLLEDRAGRLWIGTPDAGVILRQNGRFRAFAQTNGLGGQRLAHWQRMLRANCG